MGDEARSRSANVEAIAHLERGVELTQTLPEGAERNERELPLQLSLGATRIAVHGHTSEHTRRAWERAQELCEASGSPSQLAAALSGLSRFYSNASELDTAIELAEQLLALARRTGDDDHRFAGHAARGLPTTTCTHWLDCFGNGPSTCSGAPCS